MLSGGKERLRSLLFLLFLFTTLSLRNTHHAPAEVGVAESQSQRVSIADKEPLNELGALITLFFLNYHSRPSFIIREASEESNKVG